MGDIAIKATGGGLLSMNTHGCRGAAAQAKANLECGEVGTYAELQKKAALGLAV